MPTFKRTRDLPVSAQDLFAWHARPGAFERLAPPWDHITVEQRSGITDGERLIMAIHQGPLTLRWEALHQGYVEGQRFQDVQVRGPFARWVHTHRFIPLTDARSRLEDELDYALPFGWLGALLGGWFVRRMLTKMFNFRHDRTEADLRRHAEFTDRGPQRVAITGASGLIGKALTALLTTGGHEVWALVRRPADPKRREITWDPDKGTIDAAALEGMDVVIHLAGENVGGKRWSEQQKREILRSRDLGTRTLADALASLQRKPRALLSASAIGYYGDRDAPVDESAPPADDFLAQVCQTWEAATAPASDAGIRVTLLRIGVVLSPQGGALAKMLTPFKLGLGGPIGDGKQPLSWISLDDVVAAIHHLIFADDVSGPVNLTSPGVVSQGAFAKVLGRVLGRPAFFPLPKFAAKLALGEMAEVVLGGAHVVPKRLIESGFTFDTPDLEAALRQALGRR
jgi:uncharacterized protein (TIGR01777 family)